MVDYEEIQLLPSGVYRVKFKALTPGQIKSQITRTRGKLRDLRRKRNDYLVALNEIEAEMEKASRILEECQTPEIENYIKTHKEALASAEERAEAFLKEFLGEEKYADYKREGYLEFEDKLGEHWRVYADGTVRMLVSGSYTYMCVIREKGLPLPDHVVSVVQTLRERPENIIRGFQRR